MFNNCSLLPLRNMSVAVGPGATVFSMIPRGARVLLSNRVICSMAPLEVQSIVTVSGFAIIIATISAYKLDNSE